MKSLMSENEGHLVTSHLIPDRPAPRLRRGPSFNALPVL